MSLNPFPLVSEYIFLNSGISVFFVWSKKEEEREEDIVKEKKKGIRIRNEMSQEG